MTVTSDRERWATQKQSLLSYLQTGNSITQDEARARFGVMRLASRVDELRREGWAVITEMIPAGDNGAAVARYRLDRTRARRASAFLPVDFDAIPEELKALRQWVLWRGVLRDGKMTKVPYQLNGMKAKANDSLTWAAFDEVRAAYEAGQSDGVGFVFAHGGGLVGVDLDHCFNEAGQLDKRAAAVVEALDSYTEYSVSGTGLHVLIRAELAKGQRQGPLEVYPHGRYFTVTGHVYGEAKGVRPAQSEVERIVRAMTPQKKAGARPSGTGGRRYLGNDELLEKARTAANGAKFFRLWAGDTSDYPSASEADLALMCLLMFWTHGDTERAASMFGESALGQRAKWTDRADYRQRTINSARDFLTSKGVAL